MQIIGVREAFDKRIKFVEVFDEYQDGEILIIKEKISEYLYVVDNRVKYNSKIFTLSKFEKIKKATESEVKNFEDNQQNKCSLKDVFLKVTKSIGINATLEKIIISLDNVSAKIFFRYTKRLEYSQIVMKILKEINWKYKIELVQLDLRVDFMNNCSYAECEEIHCCYKLKEIPPQIDEEKIRELGKEIGIKNNTQGSCKSYKCCHITELGDFFSDCDDGNPIKVNSNRYSEDYCPKKENSKSAD